MLEEKCGCLYRGYGVAWDCFLACFAHTKGMNYLAHLYLSQPTVDSHYGNLLGDFRKGVNVAALPFSVQQGLQNHYLVDRFTDSHPEVMAAKQVFPKSQRRFAPVALDMIFDHFLIKNWSTYSSITFDDFCYRSFNLLREGMPAMPVPMQRTVSHMIEHHWFNSYASFDGITYAITRVANSIRFANQFARSVDTLGAQYSLLEAQFHHFFPALIDHVNAHAIEEGI